MEMLPRMPCTPESVQEACNTHRDWQLDGLLFYLNEVETDGEPSPCVPTRLQSHPPISLFLQGYYDAGESPLALWLKANDVAAVLHVPVDLPAPRPPLLPAGMETEVSVDVLAHSTSQGHLSIHRSPFQNNCFRLTMATAIARCSVPGSLLHHSKTQSDSAL